MKIACDVKGTLEGPKKQQILILLKAFAEAGHQVIIWSNLYSYATQAVKDNNLSFEAEIKRIKSDYPYDNDESKFFDLAIEDDRSQDYLPAKSFLWVDEIPTNIEELLKKYGVYK